MSDSLMVLVMAPGVLFSFNWKTFSITEISVAVVSKPQNAAQSLTTNPAAMTSLPRLTVPAFITNIFMKYLIRMNYLKNSYHQWYLQQRAQFILIGNICLWMTNSSLIWKCAVRSRQYRTSNGVSENFNIQCVHQDFLCFFIKIWMY